MKTKKLTFMSMLLGLALIIFTVEAQIPPIAPIPGIKLGLANVINLMTLYMLGRKESFTILVLRIVLSSIFAGNITGFMYSLSGGLVCFMFISVISVFLKENRMWIVSIFGAIGHNIGQIMMALFLLKTPQLIWYLPVLIISAVITGFFTGMVAQITLKQLRKTNYLKMLSSEENYA
ncbi:MAG: Gx transporter family protein [bacterium]|nr:Gx transporter family protein [bacterium]